MFLGKNMTTYYITSEVKSVAGWQQWRVEAESEEEALRLFRQGDVEFVDEEIEVQDIEDENVQIEAVEETDVELIFEPFGEEKLGISDEQPIDKHVKAVTEMMLERSRVGLSKYGVNLERTDLDTLAWLTHLQQELMDAANYVEVLKDRERNK
jgi:hypothetical protein